MLEQLPAFLVGLYLYALVIDPIRGTFNSKFALSCLVLSLSMHSLVLTRIAAQVGAAYLGLRVLYPVFYGSALVLCVTIPNYLMIYFYFGSVAYAAYYL
jgi:hypothetical protein